MTEVSGVQGDEATERRLRSVVSTVAASHFRCNPDDVAEVLMLALQGAQLVPPHQGWVQETAEQISRGDIVPITSQRGLDLSQVLRNDS